MNLLNEKVWVTWKYETREGKTTKPPYNPNTGGGAMPNNPDTWVSYNVAEQAHLTYGYDGIGFMLPKGVCGIDIDAHHSENNSAEADVLKMFNNAYIETSPSGEGKHIVFTVDLSKIPTFTDESGKLKLDNKYRQRNSQREIECYIGGLTNRYFTYTGEAKKGSISALNDCTDEFIMFLDKYMQNQFGDSNRVTEGNGDSSNINIQDRLNIARKAKNKEKFIALYDRGDTSVKDNNHSNADESLLCLLAYWLEGDENLMDEAFRASALFRDKYEREDYRKESIEKAIQWQKEHGGFYGPKRKKGRPTDESRTNITIESLAEELNNMGISVKFNDISQGIDLFGYRESDEHNYEMLLSRLLSDLRDKYKGVNASVLQDFVIHIAYDNRYNPVIDMLDASAWDGVDRLCEVFNALHISEKDKLSQILITKWMWQSIALLYNNSANPFGADGVLTFVGKQRIGKTSFFRTIAINQKYFRGGQRITNFDKDDKRRLLTTWIAEIGELDYTLKSDIGMIKAFITNEYDEYRLPYGRTDVKAPRRASLCATVNNTDFLIDPTGNLRFWTVPISEKVDFEILNGIDMIQLWSQIRKKYYEKDAQGFRLTTEEQEALEQRNFKFNKPITAEDEVIDILTEAKEKNLPFRQMSASEFIEQHEILKKYSANAIGRVLTKLGFEEEKTKKARTRLLPDFE